MTTPAVAKPRGFKRILSWPRARFTLAVSAALGLLMSVTNQSPTLIVVSRYVMVGFAALIVFGLFETRPKRLPRYVSRAVLQLVGILIVIPLAGVLAYVITTGGDPQWTNELRVRGLGMLVFTGMLFAPWIAVGAMLKQRDANTREQAFAFQLERGELERKVLDARLRLLQAQVEPHFLFNTLANVQALVEAGSPQASRVLSSLIAYLRAAVPRMHSATSTFEQEVELVRAYLELMQMRMPDRLQFALHVEPAVGRLHCPPMTLLTLVENAVRHGIDPSESGGRIEVDVWSRDQRCLVRVTDTGVGMKTVGSSLGTGLATLRERLQLAFNGDAQLNLTEIQPHGLCAELNFPARLEAA